MDQQSDKRHRRPAGPGCCPAVSYDKINCLIRKINLGETSCVIKKKPIPGSGPGSAGSGADQDCLAGLKRKARQVVYQTPEVRREKVAQVQEAIEAGTYEIDSGKLADILIEELLSKPEKPPK